MEGAGENSFSLLLYMKIMCVCFTGVGLGRLAGVGLMFAHIMIRHFFLFYVTFFFVVFFFIFLSYLSFFALFDLVYFTIYLNTVGEDKGGGGHT